MHDTASSSEAAGCYDNPYYPDNVYGHTRSLLEEVGAEFDGPLQFVLHGFSGFAVYLAAAGALVAWFLYLKRPDIPPRLIVSLRGLYALLANKYYFDWFNENVIAPAARGLARPRSQPFAQRYSLVDL